MAEERHGAGDSWPPLAAGLFGDEHFIHGLPVDAIWTEGLEAGALERFASLANQMAAEIQVEEASG